MGKIVIAIVFAAVCVQAQTFQDPLLPQARHIMGVVLAADGKPVVEASIDHTNDHRQAHQTDSEGRFEVDTRAPVLVIRKDGFRSELVRTQDAKDVLVTLRKLSDKRLFPTCSTADQYYGINGWNARFRFSRTERVKASRQAKDIDYGVRSYYIDADHGRKGITHGSGPLWSSGKPSDMNVWRSAKYEEVTYDAGGLPIIDARGELPNGNRWRHLGIFGETASYSDIEEGTAKILDHFLDGACLKSTQRQ